MTSAQTKNGGSLLSSGLDPKTNCTYCKVEGHNYKTCPKLKTKNKREAQNGKKLKTVYPKCLTPEKTNHPAERCCKGAGAFLKPKRNETEDKEAADDTNRKAESSNSNPTTSKTPTSILKTLNPKN